MYQGDEQPFDWAALVPRIVNPIKVTVLETLLYMDQPLSAAEIEKLHGHPDLNLSNVSYHLSSLRTKKILAVVHKKPRRGAVEKFYFFPVGRKRKSTRSSES